MLHPDFEKIRKEAVSDMVNRLPVKTPNDRKMAENLARSASIVVVNMLSEYHRQLMEYLQKNQDAR